MMHPQKHSPSAFSLVELSIVLVILGLLVGGILAGQSLIRASEIRAVGTEYSRYIAATHAFRDKYFALPGDFPQATRVWGLQMVGSGCTSTSGIAVASSPGACDGNGDGNLGNLAASQPGEVMQYWRQLALAGLIEGSYDGIAGSGSSVHCVLGTNCPVSKLSRAGWGLRYMGGYFAGNGTDWAGTYGNFWEFGGQTTSYPSARVLRPEEAWNIDTKIDDGKPGTGKMIGYSLSQCTMAANATDFSADYRLTSTGIDCAIHFMRIF